MADFDIDCPECNASVGVTVEDAAKERTVKCRNGHSIKLNDKGGAFRRAQRSHDDLLKKFKDLGK